MVLYGLLKNSVDPYGPLWSSMDLYGPLNLLVTLRVILSRLVSSAELCPLQRQPGSRADAQTRRNGLSRGVQ